MSAEYATRMEILQRKRNELTAQRHAIEKRITLREATAAEFSTVALQRYKQKWKIQRREALAAKKRNDEFVRSLHEVHKKVHDTWSRLQSDQSSSSALLRQEKAQYNRRVEQIYPAWQERLQRQRVQKLRELEDKKRAVERRRYLAKKSFEKEQTLDDLIRKTRHEVEMAENLEQNEQYERELMRAQSTNQAKEVDQSIREIASEARSVLQQQAAKQLEIMPALDDELAEKLSETFSPQNALRTLQEGSSAFTFEDQQQYEEERHVRQIQVGIPTQMATTKASYYSEDSQRRPNQSFPADETFEDDLIDEYPREAYEEPAFFSSTVAGDDQTYRNAAENDFASIGNPSFELRSQSYQNTTRSFNTVPETATLRETMYSKTEPQRVEPSSERIHNDTGYDGFTELPTLRTGALYPIPETDEPPSLCRSKPMVHAPDKADVKEYEHENTSTGASASTSSKTISAIAANSHTRSFKVPTSIPPAETKESHALSSMEVLTAVTTSIDDTVYSQNVDQSNEYRTNSVAPESMINETKCFEPPVQSAPELVESFARSSAEVSWHEPNNELRRHAEDGDTLPSKKPAIDKGSALSLSVVNSSIPSQSDAPSYTNILDVTDPESQLGINEIAAEEIATDKETASAEAVSCAHFENDTNEFHHTSENKIASICDDSTNNTVAANQSKFASGVVETPPELVQEYAVEEVSTEAHKPLPLPIFGRMDSLEPFTLPALSPVSALQAEDDMLLTSMHSDDFDLAASSIQPAAETNPSNVCDTTIKTDTATAVNALVSPAELPVPAAEEISAASITAKLSPVDRLKALGALMSRVEEGAAEGDTLGGSNDDTQSSNESKRELLKMAVGGRTAQIAFFGSDICFELILDISRDVGPVLFPPKAFEGIMNDQKIRKLHQSSKDKQLGWTGFMILTSGVAVLTSFFAGTLKAMLSTTLIDLFVTAFLAHDPDNQRSQRKLREFLVTVSGGGSKTPSPQKAASTTSPPKQDRQEPSPKAITSVKSIELDDRIGTPQLLQTAFLQRQSPPKLKVFGIASSSFKDRSSGSSDVLTSMGSGTMRLSQKLMRGGKMNDYSEFEEEEEVDLQNLIGMKPTFASSSPALARLSQTKPVAADKSTAKEDTAQAEDEEFDADF